MESFATLIKNRRSIRKFTGQLLNPDQVEMILKAALMAPCLLYTSDAADEL